MNKDDFVKIVNENFNGIDSSWFDNIEKYKNILQEENKKTNLTRLDSDDVIYDEYFLQSIIPFKNFKFDNNVKLLDIGSGSGIPGIVLKILYPKIELTIIESNLKKINFMKKLSEELKLRNIRFINDRVEEFGKKNREVFDIITARAVAELKVLLEVSIPILKINGICIFPKSINLKNELERSKKIINELELDNIWFDNFVFNNKSHEVFYCKKERKTPDLFPRLWKDIIK